MKIKDFDFIDSTTGDWSPDRSGSYTEQCERGRLYAGLLIQAMIATANTQLLGAVVQAIQSNGEYSGIEAGFFSHVSARIIATS